MANASASTQPNQSSTWSFSSTNSTPPSANEEDTPNIVSSPSTDRKRSSTPCELTTLRSMVSPFHQSKSANPSPSLSHLALTASASPSIGVAVKQYSSKPPV